MARGPAPRIVFFGSSDSVFSNAHFGAFVDAGCRIVAAVDVPPARRSSTNAASAEEESFVAGAARLRAPVLCPESPNAPDVIQQIRALAPDALVAVGYLPILRDPLLAVPRVVAANFHASLLPAYRGKHPVFWALRNGEAWSGITIHVMTRDLDAGDIIFQRRVRIRRSDSVSTLYERIIDRGLSLVPRLTACIAAGLVPRKPQNERLASRFGPTREEDFRLDWSLPAAVLERWVRATPGKCFMETGGHRLFFLDARASRMHRGKPPGAVIRLTGGACAVCTAFGSLTVHRIRDESGLTAAAAEAMERMG